MGVAKDDIVLDEVDMDVEWDFDLDFDFGFVDDVDLDIEVDDNSKEDSKTDIDEDTRAFDALYESILKGEYCLKHERGEDGKMRYTLKILK